MWFIYNMTVIDFPNKINNTNSNAKILFLKKNPKKLKNDVLCGPFTIAQKLWEVVGSGDTCCMLEKV